MHPAPSIIAFTTFSGLGFGLLFWLGLDPTPPTGWVAFAFYAIAYVFACGGLLASAFHLGHPERALRAFTQWRTSWLSREAWAAVAALTMTGVHAALLVFTGKSTLFLGGTGSVLALATVYCTAMIYGQLRTVPRWHSPLTPALFLSLALAGGAVLAAKISFALPLLLIAGAVQMVWWQRGDTALADSGTTLSTATGLMHGPVRAFEPPHTGPNYLLKEMVYVVARRHAVKLRLIGQGLMVGVPVLILALTQNHFAALIAVISHIAGALTTRWLFFAEAEHVVGLYYGKR